MDRGRVRGLAQSVRPPRSSGAETFITAPAAPPLRLSTSANGDERSRSSSVSQFPIYLHSTSLRIDLFGRFLRAACVVALNTLPKLAIPGECRRTQTGIGRDRVRPRLLMRSQELPSGIGLLWDWTAAADAVTGKC